MKRPARGALLAILASSCMFVSPAQAVTPMTVATKVMINKTGGNPTRGGTSTWTAPTIRYGRSPYWRFTVTLTVYCTPGSSINYRVWSTRTGRTFLPTSIILVSSTGHYYASRTATSSDYYRMTIRTLNCWWWHYQVVAQ